MRLRFAFAFATFFQTACVEPASATESCASRLTPLREALFLERTAPQAIARDRIDGSFWISLGLSLDLVRISPDLSTVEVVSTDLPADENNIFDGLTGLAYDESRDTLLVVRPVLLEIAEVDRNGRSTGRTIPLRLPSPPTLSGLPGPRGLTFGPTGHLWLVESSMTAVYEIDPSDGRVLSQFCHPDDPDGCPGERASAAAHGIQAFVEGGGELFLDIIGGGGSKDRIRRVGREGRKTGLEYDLSIVGGSPSGFLRARMDDPRTGGETDALLVLVESSAELHVLAVEEPESIPPFDLELSIEDGDTGGVGTQRVDLEWTNGGDYESVEILRDGESIAELPGDARLFRDETPPDGVLTYSVLARAPTCTGRLEGSVVVGAGRVLASNRLAGQFAIDLAEDLDEQLWIALADNRLVVHDKDLQHLITVPGPFRGEEEVTGAIAYDATADSILVYNNLTHEVAEVDVFGEPTGRIFRSGVAPVGDLETASVTAMLFDPDGHDGRGSLWFLEYYSSTILEHGLDGVALESCRHPDLGVDQYIPPDSDLRPYSWGMSTLPGRGFDTIELSAGTIRDRRSTRLSRLNTSSCLLEEGEVPLEDVEALRVPFALAVHRSEHRGRPVIYAIAVGTSSSLLLELDAREPRLGHVEGLVCSQPRDTLEVDLSFRAPRDAESVEVYRQGELIATIESSATRFIDVPPASGFYEYRVRAVRGEERSDDRFCSLRVGAGSFAERVFCEPLRLVRDLAYDALASRYYAVTSSNARSRLVHVFDEQLRLERTLDSRFDATFRISTLAVREADGASEIYCLGWRPGSPPGQTEFPVRVLDGDGRLRRQESFVIPPPDSVFVTFPSSMVWDRELDAFWLLEKNSKIVYRLSPSGELLSKFRHPEPPFQDDVQSFGFAISAERGALYLSTSGPGESAPSRIVELTRRGELTGVEIPLDVRGYRSTWGIDLHARGRSFVVAAGSPKPWEFRVVRAFDDLAAVEDLSCVPTGDGSERRVTWTNGAQYDLISIFRGATEAAVLGGSDTEWVDQAPTADDSYRVVGWLGDLRSPSAICGGEAGAVFLRGDVEPDGVIRLSDAVYILGFLFRGAAAPSCLDAADVDDDGTLNLGDAIRLLNYLFLGGAAPAAPFAQPGRDWTPDPLTCFGDS